MAQDKVEIVIESTDKTAKGIKSAEGSFKQLGKTIAPLITAGFGVAAIKAATDAYMQQEEAVAQLNARLKSTNNAVGISSDGLQRLASELQGVTRYGDESIIKMQSLMLTFTNIGGKVFPQATEAILNVSTAMGQDLQTSALQVGKALNDPIAGVTALARSGIQFTDAQKEMIKSLVEGGDTLEAQKIILGELETQFGGAARAARDTYGGALQALKNDFGDLLEIFGEMGAGEQQIFFEEIGAIVRETGAILREGAGDTSLMATALSAMEQVLRGVIGAAFLAEAAFDAVGSAIGATGAAISLAAEGEFGLAKSALEEYSRDAGDIIDDVEKKLLRLDAATARNADGTIKRGPVRGIDTKDDLRDLPKTKTTQEKAEENGLWTDKDQQVYNEWVNARLEADQFYADETLRIKLEELANIENIEALKLQATQSSEAMRMQTTWDTAQGIANILQIAGQKNKAIATAGFILTKGIALAQTYVSTQAAAVAALAPPPIGLGPVAGAGLAASMEANGYIRMGLIAATAITEAVTKGGGGSAQANTANPYGASNAIQPVGQPATTQTSRTLGADIEIRGNSLIAKIVEDEIIPAMNEATARGVKLVFT